MKKILISLLLVLFTQGISLAATELVHLNHPTPLSNCEIQKDKTYYVGDTAIYFSDNLISQDISKFFLIRQSSVSIYMHNSSVFTFINGGKFKYFSQILPKGVSTIYAVGQEDGMGTKIKGHANTRNTIAGQFVYTINGQMDDGKFSNSSTTYSYKTSAQGATQRVPTKASFKPIITLDNECFNVYVGRCGDGILDNGNNSIVDGISTSNGQLAGNEQCDNGSNNGKDGKCNIDCTIITTPQPYCGDGKINQASEQCDNGSNNGKDGKCNIDCTIITTPQPYCGDGKINQTSEQCDDGVNNGKAGYCSPTCTFPEKPGFFGLTKTLSVNKIYLSGDIVEFRIDFQNNSTTVANSVILEDQLPNSLEYVESSISLVNTTLTTYQSGGSLRVKYSNFNLNPGQSGYMIIRGKLKQEYSIPGCGFWKINSAIISAKGYTSVWSSATFECGQPVPPTPASCKTITVSGDGTTRNVSCLGNSTIINTTPISINCGNGNTLGGFADNIGVFSKICSYGSASEAQRATIFCTVANDTNNLACKKTGERSDCKIESDAIVAIVGDDQNNNEVTYTCSTIDGSIKSLSIDCGNGQSSYSELDRSMSYRCKYTTSDYNRVKNTANHSIKAKCLVDNTYECSVDTILDKGFLGICGNGVREGYEQCDAGGYKGKGTKDGQKCLEGCILDTCEECDERLPDCLSISNSNISIQNNEILPFWWRLYKTDNGNIVSDTKTCDPANFNKYDKDGRVMVKEDTLKCSFSIRQPGTNHIISIDTKSECDMKNIPNIPLFKNFYPEIWTNAFGSSYVKFETLLNTLNAKNRTIFGEYKIRLDELNYQYCNCIEDKCKWTNTEMRNICETNFTVTRPYLIQKNAFGSLPRATDAKLDNFFDMKGDPLINKTDLADVTVLNGSDYDGASDAQQIIITETNKIAKLALPMDSNKIPTLLKNTGVSVKKVPNKAIYLLESTNKKTVTINPNSEIKAPFTIITKNINLVIEGSMGTNGLFVAQGGTINFKNNDCSAPQIVKGIFVTSDKFTTDKIENTNDGKNKDKLWCEFGNLHVKGILIGSNIDELVQNRRSNLSQWFRVSGSEQAQRIQRRNQIFNGASLLIEYNPDLWKELPPGADKFVNLLDVYKK